MILGIRYVGLVPSPFWFVSILITANSLMTSVSSGPQLDSLASIIICLGDQRLMSSG